MTEDKVVAPYRDTVEEREVVLADLGTFVIKTRTKRVNRDASAKYNLAWWQGLKQGLLPEAKSRAMAREMEIFSDLEEKYDGDIFDVLEAARDRVLELTRAIDGADEGEEWDKLTAELEERTALVDEINGHISSVLPPSLEDYAEPARDAVVMSRCVFQKLGGKLVPVWKDEDAYLDSPDNMLKFILRIQMSMMEMGVEDTDENLQRIFSQSPDLVRLLRDFREQQQTGEEVPADA